MCITGGHIAAAAAAVEGMRFFQSARIFTFHALRAFGYLLFSVYFYVLLIISIRFEDFFKMDLYILCSVRRRLCTCRNFTLRKKESQDVMYNKHDYSVVLK